MRSISFITLIIALCAVSSTAGGGVSVNSGNSKPLGINCRGSFFCAWGLEGRPIIQHFYDAIVSGSQLNMLGGPVPDERMYFAGGDLSDIACIKGSNVCLFLQGNVPPTGVNGSTIKKRLGDLRDHGCHICGSVPLSGDNDPAKMGILVANFVTKGSCDGVCPQHTRH